MPLDRGILARIDRRVLSELDHEKGTQFVKVPVSNAVWSIWRRYCDVLGISMGGAISMLIERELSTVDDPDLDKSVAFLETQRSNLEEQERLLVGRKNEMDSDRRRLEALESELNARAKRQPQPSPGIVSPSGKIGRNDPCYCGSRRKYKVCHGSPS